MATGSPCHPCVPHPPSTGTWQPPNPAQAAAICHRGMPAALTQPHPHGWHCQCVCPQPTMVALERLLWPLLKLGDVTDQL